MSGKWNTWKNGTIQTIELGESIWSEFMRQYMYICHKYKSTYHVPTYRTQVTVKARFVYAILSSKCLHMHLHYGFVSFVQFRRSFHIIVASYTALVDADLYSHWSFYAQFNAKRESDETNNISFLKGQFEEKRVSRLIFFLMVFFFGNCFNELNEHKTVFNVLKSLIHRIFPKCLFVKKENSKKISFLQIP